MYMYALSWKTVYCMTAFYYAQKYFGDMGVIYYLICCVVVKVVNGIHFVVMPIVNNILYIYHAMACIVPVLLGSIGCTYQ